MYSLGLDVWEPLYWSIFVKMSLYTDTIFLLLDIPEHFQQK